MEELKWSSNMQDNIVACLKLQPGVYNTRDEYGRYIQIDRMKDNGFSITIEQVGMNELHIIDYGENGFLLNDYFTIEAGGSCGE